MTNERRIEKYMLSMHRLQSIRSELVESGQAESNHSTSSQLSQASQAESNTNLKVLRLPAAASHIIVLKRRNYYSNKFLGRLCNRPMTTTSTRPAWDRTSEDELEWRQTSSSCLVKDARSKRATL